MGDHVAVPMTFGLLSPVILLPSDASPGPTTGRVLVHEMSHIRRLDGLMLLIARAACAVYWFHPLVWLGARRLRPLNANVRVMIRCSRAAQSRLTMPTRFSIQPQGSGSALPWGALSMARPSALEIRVRSILDKAGGVGKLPSSLRDPDAAAGMVLPLSMLRTRSAAALLPSRRRLSLTGMVVDEKNTSFRRASLNTRFVHENAATTGPERHLLHGPRRRIRPTIATM